MPVLRNGRQIGIMSQADEGEAGASQQTAVILSPLDEFKMKNEVAKQLRAGGAFNGDRSKTKGFVERVERMFGGSVGDYLSPKLRAEAVVESFGPEVEKSFGLVRTAELLSSWDNVKEWIQSNYGDPNNPRLEAVRVLKKISFVGRSVPKETERLAEAFKELGMDPKTAALFYVDAMSEESVFDFMSQYGRVFENWDFQELVATVNPMAEKFNQKAKQARGGPTDKPAYTPKPPTKRSGGGFNYAAMLESLSAVKWLTGDYKPANVEALKAKLDDTNPDSENAASRRCEVTWSWFSEANQAGLDLKMDQKMEFNTQLNVSELNTYSVVAEPTVGWSSEPTFAAVKDDAVPLTTVYNAVLNKKNVRVLIDNGSSFNIVSESFVRKNEWQTNAAAAVNVTLADGRRHSGDRVLRNSKLKLGCVNDTLNLRVYPVQNYDVILGVPWLIKMKANIDFSSGDLVVLKNGRVKKIKSATTVAKESNAGRRPDWLLSKKSFKKLLKRTDELERHNTHSVCYMIEGEHIEGLLLAEKDLGFSMQTPNRPAGVAVTADNYATATTADNDVSKKIERLLSDYADLFPTSSPGLPPERGIVHEIKLKQGTAPVHRTPYRMSVAQEDELRKRLKELLDLGLIRHSKSPWASPVLFVPKKDGSLRFCVDYRGLNKVTVRDEHSLPIVEDQIRRLTGAKVFSKVDCFNGFYQIAMAAADVEKTAFTTPYGLFEFLVMPFGLNNAPATFSRLMMNIFQDYINDFVLVYMDDILIFSKDEAEHETHLKLVLDRLREKGLVAKKSKCSFFKTDIDYLGFVVSADGVKMAADKVQAVLEWPTPSNASEVRGFLGLSGFYRNFIRNYAHIVAPLNELTKKNMVYIWTPLHAERFDELKRAVTTAPVLQVYDPTQQCVVCTDASNIAVGAVLMQAASDGSGAAPKPVAFFSRKLRGAELNYDARTKEFLAIKLTAHKWRHYLNNGETPIFFTDHESLQYLNTSTELSPKFMRWFSSITSWLGGPPTIRYKPGKLNVVADALSRRPDHSHCLYALSLVVPADELMQQIRDGLKVDEFALAEAEKRSAPLPYRVVTTVEIFPQDEKGRIWRFNNDLSTDQTKNLNFQVRENSAFSTRSAPHKYDFRCHNWQTSSVPSSELVEIVVLGLPFPARGYRNGPAAARAFAQLCDSELGLPLHLDNIIHVKYTCEKEGSRSRTWLWLDRDSAQAIMTGKQNLPAGITVDRVRAPAEVRSRWRERNTQDLDPLDTNQTSHPPVSAVPTTVPQPPAHNNSVLETEVVPIGAAILTDPVPDVPSPAVLHVIEHKVAQNRRRNKVAAPLNRISTPISSASPSPLLDDSGPSSNVKDTMKSSFSPPPPGFSQVINNVAFEEVQSEANEENERSIEDILAFLEEEQPAAPNEEIVLETATYQGKTQYWAVFPAYQYPNIPYRIVEAKTAPVLLKKWKRKKQSLNKDDSFLKWQAAQAEIVLKNLDKQDEKTSQYNIKQLHATINAYQKALSIKNTAGNGGNTPGSLVLQNIRGQLMREALNLEIEDDIDIIMLNEIWLHDVEELPYIPGFKLSYGAARPITARATGYSGAAIYIKQENFGKIDVWRVRESDGVIWIKCQKSERAPVQFFCCCYAAPDNTPGCPQNIDDWFEELENEISIARGLGEVLVAGDFNAHIGTEPDFDRLCAAGTDRGSGVDRLIMEEDMVHACCPRTSVDASLNSRGKKLLQLCDFTGLYVVNGRVAGDIPAAATCLTNSKSKEPTSVIDLFLACPKVFIKTESLKVGGKLAQGADHLAVTVTINEFMSMSELMEGEYEADDVELSISNSTPSFNIGDEFIIDPKLLPAFKAELQAAAPLLEQICVAANDTAESKNANMLNTAEADLRKVLSNACVAAGMKIKGAAPDKDRWARKMNKLPPALKLQQKQARSTHRRAVRECDVEAIVTNRNNVKRSHRNIRKARRSLGAKRLERLLKFDPKEFYQKYRRPPSPTLVSQSDLSNHFEQLLGAEPPDLPVPPIVPGTVPPPESIEGLLQTPFSMEELLPALKKVRNGAAMLGILKPQLLKSALAEIGPTLLELLNASVAVGKLPTAWALSAITAIPKAGSDTRTCDGYRGIAVGTLAAKLHGSMLDIRTSCWAEASELRAEGQFGFRRGKGTASASFILRALTDRVKAQKGGRLYTCFVDFKKAYDSVPRHLLWAKLERRGVTGWVLNAIKAMYADVPMCVKSSTGLGRTFQSKLGVKQGCPLSPLLFGLYLDDWDDELRAAAVANNSESTEFDFPTLNNMPLRSLMYADDLVQAATSMPGLRKQMALLEDFSVRWGLTINASKTKLMLFSGIRSIKEEKAAVLYIDVT
ncbi:hypothetical protein KSW81_003798 [Nannochloris sp. 'desiccata']|nr:hypothetical protein KSW81_003798 [Chlorella desiccata (nom. nud.)]